MPERAILALVPAYNPNVAELAATIRSLMQQTVATDVCVIDDGSASAVASLLPTDGRVKVIRLARNGGITGALRAGVAYGLEHNYDYFCRLDVGDVSYPERLAWQLDFMKAHPDIDLVGGYSRVIDPAGRTLFLHGVSGGSAAVHSYLRKNAPFKHSTFFFRADAARRWGNYDEAFGGAEDYELLLRLAKHSKIDCIPQTVIDYVDDPKGISTRKRGLQLRKRLKAQLAHADPGAPGWYAGVARALLTMATPYGVMKRISTLTWARRGGSLKA